MVSVQGLRVRADMAQVFLGGRVIRLLAHQSWIYPLTFASFLCEPCSLCESGAKICLVSFMNLPWWIYPLTFRAFCAKCRRGV